ncbi:uncharacterized protein LOC109363809 [Meleagris gallopavo]|uniref:uncharacterized protein LOC109363809 n=1 Tax=Meleagris gallopavo TaxID=9103 RepID=UPI0009398AB8|nr:uncharacterized protein LOC109363809 [Meleagris gallopavo]
MKPGMPPPSSPAHCYQGIAGTLQPQQPMGLWPGAVLHGKPAGSCPLQAPGSPSPSTLLRGQPVQQHVLPVPCTLLVSREQAVQPFGDAVVLTEDQGHPATTNVCPHPTSAPLTCSTAALESGAATTSSNIPEDISDINDLLSWMNNEVAPKTEVPHMDDLLVDDHSAECPAPACTTSGHQQHTGSTQALKRKLPQGHDGSQPKRRR